ncbi:MAG: hypothetical protein AVDCRST_MAG89-4245, partial [uncultured Gemmatimonadetes bacterium]
CGGAWGRGRTAGTSPGRRTSCGSSGEL